MLSVNTEYLKNAEEDLKREAMQLKNIADRLQNIEILLAEQGDRTFAVQIQALCKQYEEIEEEIRCLKILRNSLENIFLIYEEYERKNEQIQVVVSDHLHQSIYESKSVWDLVQNNTIKLARENKCYPCYEKSIVDEKYNMWIRPMMG